MADLGTLNNTQDEIAQEYKARAVSTRFKQQMSYGIGAAMVFGLVSALAKGLWDVAGASYVSSGIISGSFLLPVAGLIGVAVLGITALYFSAKYLSENVLLDNEMQAKKIQEARSKAQEAARTTTPNNKPTQEFPAKAEEMSAEAPEPSSTKWTDKFTPSASLPLLAKNDNEKSWGDKVKSAESSVDKQLVAL